MFSKEKNTTNLSLVDFSNVIKSESTMKKKREKNKGKNPKKYSREEK